MQVDLYLALGDEVTEKDLKVSETEFEDAREALLANLEDDIYNSNLMEILINNEWEIDENMVETYFSSDFIDRVHNFMGNVYSDRDKLTYTIYTNASGCDINMSIIVFEKGTSNPLRGLLPLI